MFNVSDHDQHDTSKTLTFANQSENPNKQFIFLTCFSSIETKSRYFMMPFAVADGEYHIHGTLVFEKYIQNINIQNFTKNFKHPPGNRSTIASFTLFEKSFFSFFHQVYSEKPIDNKFNTVQTVHFPSKK